MSMSGLNTKKVTTYGRKKTQIISVRADLSPDRKAAPLRTPIPDDLSSVSSSSRSPSPVRVPSRPPLKSIVSQNILPSKPVRGAKEKAKCKLVESPPSSPEFSIISRPKAFARQRVVPRSPSFVPSSPESRPASPVMTRRTIECVEIPQTPRFKAVRAGRRMAHTPRARARKSTPTEDLAGSLAKVTIESNPSPAHQATNAISPTSVDQLLSACSSSTVHSFTDFLHSTTLLHLASSHGKAKYQKIGEASYSEVFGLSRGGDDIIVKVIPLSGLGFPVGRDAPDCSDPADVLREVQITQRMSKLGGGGFVGFLGAFVVEGVYPSELLHEWDAFDEAFKSHSVRPDVFSARQQYALVVLTDGGDDLEASQMDLKSGWLQAASIFWQTVEILARAEEEVRFEHRDLHQGQILISPVPTLSTVSNPTLPSAAGVQVTIIDFGLSRLDTPTERTRTNFVPLPSDVYDGEGDQWDVYRSMRDATKGDWEGFHPITNLMWINYILKYLLYFKSLRKPSTRAQTVPSAASGPLRPTKRVLVATKKTTVIGKSKGQDKVMKAYVSLKEMEGTLSDALNGKGRKGRSLGSARDIMYLGAEKGWIG